MDKLMPRPGPKPVDIEHLKGEATAWATFFYKLRDGEPGLMQRIEWREATHEELQRMNWYRFVKRHPEFKKRPPQRGRYLEPPIMIPVSDAAFTLPPEIKAKGWVIERPLQPAPELWEQLKRARSVAEIKKAARRIKKWMDSEPNRHSCLPGVPAVEIPDALDTYAEKLRIGMKLATYAKTDRPRSDDKRVNHLAKVLAGARLGLEPITAVKRLSHWTWPRDWAEKVLRGLMEEARQSLSTKTEMGKP
jgi:hypothetical protein